jgi:hypothetical protein
MGQVAEFSTLARGYTATRGRRRDRVVANPTWVPPPNSNRDSSPRKYPIGFFSATKNSPIFIFRGPHPHQRAPFSAKSPIFEGVGRTPSKARCGGAPRIVFSGTSPCGLESHRSPAGGSARPTQTHSTLPRSANSCRTSTIRSHALAPALISNYALDQSPRPPPRTRARE